MALDPQLLAFEIPFGKEGMKPRLNRLLAKPTDLITAANVSFEDDNLRKEAGATTFDATGLLGIPVFNGTLSTARKYDSTLLEFASSNAEYNGTVGTAYVAAGASGVITVTIGAGLEILVGDLVVVSLATQSDVAANYSIADSGGVNVWTKLASTVAVAGVTSICWWTIATAHLLNTATITATDSVGVANAKAMTVSSFAFISNHTGLDAQGGSDTTTAAIQSGPGSPFSSLGLPKLVIVPMATIGPDTDTITVRTSDAGRQWVAANKKGTTVTAWLQYAIYTTAPTIIGLFDWHPDSATQRLISVGNDGNVYKEVGGDTDAVVVCSGLPESPTDPIVPFFVPGGVFGSGTATRKLFLYNGLNQPQVLSGDGGSLSMAHVAHPPVDWATPLLQPVAGTIHLYRHCGFGNSNFPHTLYWSSADDHEDFREASASGTGFHMNCDSSVGDRLYASAHFQGVLHFWKYPRGIFYLDDSDQIPANWATRTKSEGIGCAPSPYAVCAMDDDVIFMAADGQFHLLSAVNTLGGTRTSSLSRSLGLNQWIRDNVNMAQLSRVISDWHPNKKVATFWVPGTGTTFLFALKFDFGQVQEGGEVRFSYSVILNDTVSAATIRRDSTTTVETPISASLNFIYLMDRTTRLYDSAAYDLVAQTPHHDLSSTSAQAQVYAPNQTQYGAPGMATKRKLFEQLELVMNVGTGTID